MFRPSSSTDGDTEKRYSERKVRERERDWVIVTRLGVTDEERL